MKSKDFLLTKTGGKLHRNLFRDALTILCKRLDFKQKKCPNFVLHNDVSFWDNSFPTAPSR